MPASHPADDQTVTLKLSSALRPDQKGDVGSALDELRPEEPPSAPAPAPSTRHRMAVSLERSAPGLNPIVFLRFNAVKTWMPPASGQQRQETTEESYFWFTEK